MGKSSLAPKIASLLGAATNATTRPAAQVRSARRIGIYAALSSAFFMGMTPVFGKEAIIFGAPPMAVVALRTLLAALLLFIVILLFRREYLYIYPAGLLGCFLAGLINGLGSLFYYSALARIDASVGHLLYSLYPLFLIFWLSLDHQPPARLTLLRLLLAIPAIYLLTQARGGQVDLIGFGQMLVAAGLYALHIPINQRVLYDMPAPTVTLYTLVAMSAIVVPVYMFSGSGAVPASYQVWWSLTGLTLVTFLSRLMLFLGVKHLGGMQTALLGLSELLVAIIFAYLWLGERFSHSQWIGAIFLILSLLLVFFEKPSSHRIHPTGWLSWLHSPGE